jgi:hypothetical protein
MPRPMSRHSSGSVPSTSAAAAEKKANPADNAKGPRNPSSGQTNEKDTDASGDAAEGTGEDNKKGKKHDARDR